MKLQNNDSRVHIKNNDKFLHNLQLFILKKNLSPEKLVELMKINSRIIVSPYTIEDYLANSRECTSYSIIKSMASVFGISVDQLLTKKLK